MGPYCHLQGIDDVLALLLALSASPEDLEILLISVTYGNVEVQKFVVFFSLFWHGFGVAC